MHLDTTSSFSDVGDRKTSHKQFEKTLDKTNETVHKETTKQSGKDEDIKAEKRPALESKKDSAPPTKKQKTGSGTLTDRWQIDISELELGEVIGMLERDAPLCVFIFFGFRTRSIWSS